MKKIVPFGMFLLLGAAVLHAQSSPPDPDDILVGGRKLPSVLLVGCFHFAYRNLDVHKVAEEDQVDILSPGKQNELQELLAYIGKFKPTKIAVERERDTRAIMDQYREYRAGTRPLGKDEIEQIGFRLMERFDLDTLYGVNDVSLAYELYEDKDSLRFRTLLDSIYADWDGASTDSVSARYSRLFTAEDRMEKTMTLLECFQYSNSDKALNRGHGAYLVGDFTLGDTRGADGLAMHWYSRNLRIFRRIQQIAVSPDDRILVIFGGGHIPILKHLFECSPEYRLVKFGDLR